jgi:5'-deoxynucleotidase YfbR-like HD superfamily hydrolase
MSNSRTITNIFESSEFVVSELTKIQTLYELKRVIRYNHKREHEQHTESVAEHIFGMHCLVEYFLPLEDPTGAGDKAKIHAMVQYHDIDEIITGDTIGYLKDPAAEASERVAAEMVIQKLPTTVQSTIRALLDEYEKRETFEAKFVKAIDKTEPIFHTYNEAGKQILNSNRTTRDQHERIKHPYIQDFPIIKRFVDVMTTQFEHEGFFHPGP